MSFLKMKNFDEIDLLFFLERSYRAGQFLHILVREGNPKLWT